MAKENLNIGSAANDGTGDTLRDGAIKLNNVINEVYNALGDGTNVQIDIGTPAAGQVLRWNGSTAFVGSHYDALSSNLDVAGNQITSSSDGNVVVKPHGTGDIHLWAGSSGSPLTYIDGADGKLKYSAVYSNLADLPDATTHHGMFAHVHNTAHGYFAHSPSGETVNVAVTVGVDTVGGQATGVFYLDGTEKPSNFPLVRGNTYVFDQSDASNENYNSMTHPLMFSTGADGDHNGNGHYMSGVQYKLDGSNVTMAGYTTGFAAATTRTVEWTIPSDAPATLYYWCHHHTGQGSSFAVSDPVRWRQLLDVYSSIGELKDVDMAANGGPSDGQVLKWVASANAFQAANDDSTTGGGGGTTQNLFETVNADTGTTTASAANDTLIIAGGSSISTSISGDTVTIAYTGAAGAPDQNIFETFNADSGTRTAAATDDSFTFTGGTGITTSISGAAITITNDAPNIPQFIIQSVSGDTGSFTSSDVEGGISIVGGTNVSTVMSGSTLTINNTAAALPTATDGQSLIYNGSGYEGVATPTISFQITANGSTAYRFAGGGVDPNTDDPTIYVYRGFTYRFDNTVGGPHPFALRITSGGSAVTEGVSGSQNGVQYWTVPMDLAPGTTYVYQCTQHPLMVGNLTVV
tara:strand:- start:2680 stop:4584 length:1905 start_codon:yes stop_codon:yes gene_type:complete